MVVAPVTNSPDLCVLVLRSTGTCVKFSWGLHLWLSAFTMCPCEQLVTEEQRSSWLVKVKSMSAYSDCIDCSSFSLYSLIGLACKVINFALFICL